MKEQDFLNALGKVPQEMLDELAEWQASGAPLTELDSADLANETVTRLQMTQRRNKPMKQTRKQSDRPERMLPWKLGIGAAMAACLVAAVSVGREAISRQHSAMQAGYSDLVSEIGEQEVELIAVEPLFLSTLEAFPVSETGTVRLISNADDIALLNDAEIPELIGYSMNENFLAENDMMIIGCRADLCPTPIYTYDYRDGTVTAEGSLSVELGIVTANELPEDRGYSDGNFYLYCAVPKDSLPEITDCEVTFTEFCVGDLPEDIMENPNEWDAESNNSKLGVYMESHTAYQAYWDSLPTPRCLRKLPAEQQVPENDVEVVEMEALPEPMSAWDWEHYKGNDIAIPAEGTVTVIRTLADAKAYRTGSSQQKYQNSQLEEILSLSWLEGSSDGETKPHDVIFIGMPAGKMPRNTVRWNYHAGTVTPSGRLHLDFSVLSLTEMPEVLDYDSDTNFYYFISVPKGELPDITAWDVTFTESRSDEYPNDRTLAAPNEIAALGETRLENWLHNLPEVQNELARTLCDKYIDWVYDDTDTVEALGVVVMNLDVSVSHSYGNRITNPESGITGAYLNYVFFDKESRACAGVVDTLDGYRELRDAMELGNYELYVNRREGFDLMVLVLPVHDARAQTAITDMRISQDGLLSLTLNEYYGSDDVDTSQDTASVVWQIMVPHGSVPKITAVDLNRNLVEHIYSVTKRSWLERDLEFIKHAGKMITVTRTNEDWNPASAIIIAPNE